MSNVNPERAKAELVNYLEGRVEAGHTSGSPILRAALDYARGLPATDPRFAELPAGGFDALGVYQWLKTGGSRNWSAPASPEDGQTWLDDYFAWRPETGDNLPNPEDLV